MQPHLHSLWLYCVYTSFSLVSKANLSRVVMSFMLGDPHKKQLNNTIQEPDHLLLLQSNITSPGFLKPAKIWFPNLEPCFD